MRLFFVTQILFLLMSYQANAESLNFFISAQDSCLLGSSRGKVWITFDKTNASQASLQSYKIYHNGQIKGELNKPKMSKGHVPCAETQFLDKMSDQDGYAVAKVYSTEDSSFELLDPSSKVYQKILEEYLVQNAFTRPQVKIKQLIRTDLENDGKKEIIIVGSHLSYYPPTAGEKKPNLKARANKGAYSVALLRQIVGGKVVTTTLWADLHQFETTEQDTQVENEILGVHDLNGDGKKEIIFSSRYYEGESTAVLEIIGNKVKEVLSCGCGA